MPYRDNFEPLPRWGKNGGVSSRKVLRYKNNKLVNRVNQLQKSGDAVIARKVAKPKKQEVTWMMETPNPKQMQAFLAKTLYVGYGGAKGGG